MNILNSNKTITIDGKKYRIVGSLNAEIKLDEFPMLELKNFKIRSGDAKRMTLLIPNDNTGIFEQVKIGMMMLGKWKNAINDGLYISFADIKKAIEEAVTKDTDYERILVTDKRQKFNNTIFDDLFHKITGDSDAVFVEYGEMINRKKVSYKNVGIFRADDSSYKRTGAVFLGKKKVKANLKSGVWINQDEFLKAIKDFVIAEEIQKEKKYRKKENKKTDNRNKRKFPWYFFDIKKEKENENKNEYYRYSKIIKVVNKTKSHVSLTMAIIALVSFLLASINLKDKRELVTFDKVVEFVNYNIDGLEEVTPSMIEKAVSDSINNLELGSYVKVEDGDKFYSNSLLSNRSVSKTIGQDFSNEGKEAGLYLITGFSIVDKNNTCISYIQDFDGQLDEPKLLNYLNDIVKERNIDINQLEIRVHLGNNKDNSRLGWIDVKKLITADDLTDDLVLDVVDKGITYSGVTDNFPNGTIILDNGVKVNVFDKDGNLKKTGDVVVGSDNKQYIISKLTIEEEILENTVSKNVGKKISFEIQDRSYKVALIPTILAIATYFYYKKRNRDNELKPEFFGFEDGLQKSMFVSEFTSNLLRRRRDYLGLSKYEQFIFKMFGENNFGVASELSKEELKQFYDLIIETVKKKIDFDILSPNDIELEGGRIYIAPKYSSRLDVTDIVLEAIHSLGNNYSTSKIEGEINETIRRKY